MICCTDGVLQEYFDGELPVEERDAVTAHVGSCKECSGRLASIAERRQRVTALLNAFEDDVQVHPRIALAELHARAAADDMSPTTKFGRIAALVACAAVVVLAVAAGLGLPLLDVSRTVFEQRRTAAVAHPGGSGYANALGTPGARLVLVEGEALPETGLLVKVEAPVDSTVGEPTGLLMGTSGGDMLLAQDGRVIGLQAGFAQGSDRRK